MGDFEGYFNYLQTLNYLLPAKVYYFNTQYFNRQNGIIFGFKGMQYDPPPSNWTDYADSIDIS